MPTYSTSLLIATYNWPEALELVLKSIAAQTKLVDEILIADDGSDHRTRSLIESFRKSMNIPVKHFWHEDLGFRKTIIMNEALASANGDYIIQIDGDIILQRSFIADHLSEAKKGFYIKGSRSMLSASRTKNILQSKNVHIHPLTKGVGSKINATRFPFLSFLFRGDKLRSNNLRGCNFSFWKQDFMHVNGYNNELEGWGHEDIELAARLTNLGIKQRQLKMKAVCFHLYHKINARNNEDLNYKKYQMVVESGITTCKNGIRQI